MAGESARHPGKPPKGKLLVGQTISETDTAILLSALACLMKRTKLTTLVIPLAELQSVAQAPDYLVISGDDVKSTISVSLLALRVN